jgi:hypothetical protein
MNYQEILADTYRENVIEHFEEEEEEENDVDGHEEHEYDNHEVNDPDAFKKFGGNRGHSDILPKVTSFDDKSKLSVRHEKDIKRLVISVDSRFRSYSVPGKQAPTFINPNPNPDIDIYPISQSGHYLMMLHTPIRNVYSVKLTSVEFPNTFYEFDSNVYVNTSMNVTVSSTSHTVTIADGNYTSVSSFTSALQTALNTAFGGTNFTVACDPISNKITISNSSSAFTMVFVTTLTNSSGQAITSQNPYANGIGYHIGFSNNLDYNGSPVYTGAQNYTAEYVPTIVSNNYIYLSVNDWNIVHHQNFNSTRFDAFAKILLTSPKNTLFFDTTSTNSTTKQIFFQQPIDITRLDIKLLDSYGNQLNLRGGDFSITLEVEQILNMSLFEKLREL